MIPLLVPRRPDGGHRDRLWEFCRNWWAEQRPDYKPVEGHHVDGRFNRSAALNAAARDAGEWDVAVICDSDVISDPEQLDAAIDRARDTGRTTLAYDQYIALREPMTQRVLAGFDGNWIPDAELKMRSHVSSIVAVPRQLWDRVGGFDERFVGWGHDDVAFAAACRVLGGGIERVPGDVFHLWHPISPERDRRSPWLRASAELAKQYHAALTPDAMRHLIAERQPDGVCLVVVTHGRRDCIAQSIPSALAHLHGLPIVRRIISDDSGDADYQAWLRLTFPDFDIVTGKHGGFAANTIRGRQAAIASGQPWVFWLEDDFTFNRPVDMAAMAHILEERPHVTQMALRRQAWFPAELRVGGFIEQHPEAYTDFDGWMEHQLFFTTNPHLTRRSILVEHEWPSRAGSEMAFSRTLLVGDRTAGYWGTRHDEPWVHHFGERTGSGY